MNNKYKLPVWVDITVLILISVVIGIIAKYNIDKADWQYKEQYYEEKLGTLYGDIEEIEGNGDIKVHFTLDCTHKKTPVDFYMDDVLICPMKETDVNGFEKENESVYYAMITLNQDKQKGKHTFYAATDIDHTKSTELSIYTGGQTDEPDKQ